VRLEVYRIIVEEDHLKVMGLDIRGLRTLNEIGTFLVGIMGFLVAGLLFISLYLMQDDVVLKVISIVYICVIFIITISLYIFTVRGLDKGNYKAAKTWTLVGVIVGFVSGVLPFIVFLISYVSFDDAVRSRGYGLGYYNIYKQQVPFKICFKCRRQIPFDSSHCSYCGIKQTPSPSPTKQTTTPRQSVKPEPEKKQTSKPPPPPWYEKKDKKQE
jgi:hypothetical protein